MSQAQQFYFKSYKIRLGCVYATNCKRISKLPMAALTKDDVHYVQSELRLEQPSSK